MRYRDLAYITRVVDVTDDERQFADSRQRDDRADGEKERECLFPMSRCDSQTTTRRHLEILCLSCTTSARSLRRDRPSGIDRVRAVH